jgi:hypothetical protein
MEEASILEQPWAWKAPFPAIHRSGVNKPMWPMLCLLCSVACAADPIAAVSVNRDPIAARNVWCFAVQLDSVPTDAVTVNLTIGGTAEVGTDIEAVQTSVVIPSGLQTDHAMFVPVRALSGARAGRTVTCSVAAGTGYDAAVGTYTTTMQKPVSSADFVVQGEPLVVAPVNGDPWTYQLHLSRPAHVPAWAFTAAVANAPAFTGSIGTFVVGDATAVDDASPVELPVSWTAVGEGKHVRIRISTTIDIDGLPATTTSGDTNEYNDDLTVVQDLVLYVRSGGPG